MDGVAVATHGTTTAYKRGCKCDECRAAWAAYMRDWSARNKDKVAAKASKAWRRLTPEQREARRAYMRDYYTKRGTEIREKHNATRRVRRTDPEYRAQEAERAREARQRDPERAARISRKHLLKKLYGLTPEQYEEMLAAQGGGCAICGDPPGERQHAVDHDHATGEVRGILCHSCNLSIGGFRDDPSLLVAAIDYLMDHSGRSSV